MKSLHLLYHELRPAQSSYTYAIACADFERHCELFANLRRNPGTRLLPEVTFDDGHRSNYEFALPLLGRYAIPAHFFVTVGWLNTRADYMSWNELRALQAAGHTIGAHGWTHTLLTHCTSAELHHELTGARQKLEDELGCAVTTMSLPGGRSNTRILNACWEAGYAEVFTSVPRAEPVNRPARATVGRLNIRGSMTAAWLDQLLQPETGMLRKLERQEQIKSAARTMLGDTLYAKLWALANRHEAEPDPTGAAAR